MLNNAQGMRAELPTMSDATAYDGDEDEERDEDEDYSQDTQDYGYAPSLGPRAAPQANVFGSAVDAVKREQGNLRFRQK